MRNFVVFLGACFILGELAAASNPYYYYGAVGLVLASAAGCGWLMSPGTSFVSLVLFSVSLGRILVGFVYSVSGSGPLSRNLGGLKSCWVRRV
ncbi:NU6M oxidoreductase, partial [Edolisoma coerulescens]|nr:NU6M oxidoreductase [Edolisoma coerulescens]